MNRPEIRGVLFDKDGTLIDFDATWIPVYDRAARHVAGDDGRRLLLASGFDAATGKIRGGSVLAAGSAAEVAEAWIAAGADWDSGDLTIYLDDCFVAAAGGAVALADLAALFGALRGRGLAVGIASTDNERAIRATIARLGVAQLVDFVAGYDSGHGTKPGPGMVLGFCRALALDPATVAVVGDNTHDLNMARAAGAGLAVGVLSGTGSRDQLEPLADLCLPGIAQLLPALDLG